ncbi:MAG TPA: hypothetical protein VK817_10635 [Trebonia sp.]|jgi:hypothetical protein|nr:hypothetical protein [Trebonia sp.]
MADDTFGGFDGDGGPEFDDDDIEFIDDEEDDGLDLDDYEYDFDEADLEPLGFEDVADAIGLPDELPALRLPAVPELAAQARATALPVKLAALADWVGDDGRVTSDEGDLSEEDLTAAASAVGVDTDELLFLWEYALTGDWIDFADEDEDDLEAGTARVCRAQTAQSWASEGGVADSGTADGGASDTESASDTEGGDAEVGDADADVLDAWRSTFVSVLTSTFDVILDVTEDDTIAAMDFDGQGIAMAVMLFLDRGDELAYADINDVLLETATAEMDPETGREAQEAWVVAHGDPSRLILGKLMELGAVAPPDADDGAVRLTPLGLWAVREELSDVGITIPLLPASVNEMTAAQLLLVADDADAEEFESESTAWVAARDPEQAARELLRIAASDGPDSRLLAVSVVTRIGPAAEPAWRDSLSIPELRPYAKIALATPVEDAETGDLPDELEPTAEDLAWVATDMLVLACDDDEPDPDAIAECLADSVPAGEEAMLLEMIARTEHPDAVEVLKHIGKHHTDKRIAKDARTAARRAESRRANS